MNLRRTDNRKYPTLYASALLTLTKQGYTKHYFEGSRRICSKIGGGFSNVPQSDIDRRVAPVEPDYDEMHNSQRDGLVRTFAECLGAHPEPDAARDLREVVDGCLALNDPEPAFFYISDHLGGTSFLANASGNLTQTLSYLPYGEDWADVQNFAETRYPALGAYAFSGKEKDYESALLYFGARHYDSELLTAWLSVDPMADKYPSISPYAYCAWNPVKLVDPEGRDVYINGSQSDDAVAHLQSDKMTISRDENTGKLSVDIGKYKRKNLSSDERLIFDAINDENVTINVQAIKTDGHIYINGQKMSTYGGSFIGSNYNETNNTATTKCTIDVALLNKNGYNQGVPHEISEQYLAGLWSMKNKKNLPPAIQYGPCHYNKDIYDIHCKAIPEKAFNSEHEFFAWSWNTLGETSFLKTRGSLLQQLEREKK